MLSFLYMAKTLPKTSSVQFEEPPITRFLFADTRIAWVWLLVRLYVGYQWFEAGWAKVNNPAWVGSSAGTAISGFLNGALAKTAGSHPDVSGWYAAFVQHVALPNAALFSYLVTFGELAVGIGLILGLFTGIAAFFGTFMNLNYLFAGTVSTNPFLLFLQLFLILAWRVAGWFGLDRWILPAIGTPWQAGTMFEKEIEPTWMAPSAQISIRVPCVIIVQKHHQKTGRADAGDRARDPHECGRAPARHQGASHDRRGRPRPARDGVTMVRLL